jgi:hypothetical protein
LHRLAVALLFLSLPLPPAAAQAVPGDLAAERASQAEWLLTSGSSPFAVLAQRNLDPAVTLGPASADVPLDGIRAARVLERNGTAILELDGTSRTMPRWRPVPLGPYRLMVTGAPGQSLLTVSAEAPRNPKRPEYFDYDRSLSQMVRLRPPPRPDEIRLLAPDGQVVVATEAGTIEVSVAGTRTTLTVRRIPAPGGEESDLEVYFRDQTNGKGSYPAGRFVALIPAGNGQYRLDFNRARNPFCAYSSVFACPAPWRGNLIPVPVEAGEKYHGGGLD